MFLYSSLFFSYCLFCISFHLASVNPMVWSGLGLGNRSIFQSFSPIVCRLKLENRTWNHRGIIMLSLCYETVLYEVSANLERCSKSYCVPCSEINPIGDFYRCKKFVV